MDRAKGNFQEELEGKQKRNQKFCGGCKKWLMFSVSNN